MADNRIIQGGELNLGNIVNGNTGNAGTPQQAQPQSNPTGEFPKVDMANLDAVLYNFLQNSADPKSILVRGGDAILSVENAMPSGSTQEIVKSLGNEFFKLDKLGWMGGYLIGNLSINSQIPFKSFKKGLTKLLGTDIVDYFLREFGDRIGLIDETKPFDISKPEIQKYLPGIDEINKISREVVIMKNPYLLLLTLNPEDRKIATLFFNEAESHHVAPFAGFPQNSPGHSRVEKADYYAITAKELEQIARNPQILTFTDILKIGKDYNIKGVAGYADKLEEFCNKLRSI